MPQTFNVGARSLFVTVTAWIAIVLSALVSASAVVQNAFVASVAPLASGGANLPALPLLTPSAPAGPDADAPPVPPVTRPAPAPP